MISQNTLTQVVTTIDIWQKEHDVTDEAMELLLIDLAAIPGNASYKASTRAMAEYYMLMKGDLVL